MRLLAFAICAPLFAQATVPFVGCKSDGQVGPQPAPEGKPVKVLIPSAAAQRLAYYDAAQGLGVLAPRGWHCFGRYGSGGDTLSVSPEPLDFATEDFAGPAIEIRHRFGGGSGRFDVAEIIARVFPAHIGFADGVAKEIVDHADAFPSGPYPTDKLTYRNNETVEFETAANTDGLGTQSWLKKNASPVRGVAMLVGKTPDLILLAVRLPPEQADLAPIIIQQVERDAARVK